MVESVFVEVDLVCVDRVYGGNGDTPDALPGYTPLRTGVNKRCKTIAC